MIAFLRGKPAVIGIDFVAIDVNGVGYKVFMPSPALTALAGRQDEATIHTYMHVREDAMLLFGFLDEEDLKIFELLIQVSGVGPKVALAVLSSLPGAGFVQAVLQERLDILTQIPGVGRKTAQRLIIELKDKLGKLQFGTDTPVVSYEYLSVKDTANEAVEALTALGYNPGEAKRVISKITKSTDSQDIGELVRLSLKELGKF